MTSSHLYIGKYRILHLIGSGTSGSVCLAVDPEGKSYAIKTLFPNLPVVADECEIMHSYKPHPNLIHLIEKFDSTMGQHLVLPYVGPDNLMTYVNREGPFIESAARNLFRGAISGLQHLHRSGFVHRDIKCENILLKEDMTPVLCDLGLSARWSPDSRITDFCGSLHYSAPEILMRKSYLGPEVDVWALGVVLYAISAGHLPWDGEPEQIVCFAVHGDYWTVPSSSEELGYLFDNIFEPDVEFRWSLDEILLSEWMHKSDEGDLRSNSQTSAPPVSARSGQKTSSRQSDGSGIPPSPTQSPHIGFLCSPILASNHKVSKTKRKLFKGSRTSEPPLEDPTKPHEIENPLKKNHESKPPKRMRSFKRFSFHNLFSRLGRKSAESLPSQVKPQPEKKPNKWDTFRTRSETLETKQSQEEDVLQHFTKASRKTTL